MRPRPPLARFQFEAEVRRRTQRTAGDRITDELVVQAALT